MLKFQKNVYDTLEAIRASMGTNPDPSWMLIYHNQENAYSAINYDDPQDIIDYSLKNNLFAICLVDPKDLMGALNHPEPHLICQALHEFATLHRPDPDQIRLANFFPIDPMKLDPSHSSNGSPDEPELSDKD